MDFCIPFKRRRYIFSNKSAEEERGYDEVLRLLQLNNGEATQALHILFKPDSFSFETSDRFVLPGLFVTYLSLEGHSFIGYGNSKKKSRASASRVAILHIYDHFRIKCDVQEYFVVPQHLDSGINNTLYDSIASLVLFKYEEIRHEFGKNIPWYKMISGVVMVVDNKLDEAKVVALSTGSKCIESDNLKHDGSVLTDSHAEILARRAFLYYLYSVLQCERKRECIFEIEGDKNKLKKNVKFFLFINSAPCGDARVFSTSTSSTESKDFFNDQHPNRQSRGLLRIKLDGGNSTIPTKLTKDETCNRLKIMSCSDKLLKMNALGVQGNLLFNLTGAIYFSGIVIGDLLIFDHLKRALYRRIDDAILPDPFHLNRIPIYGLSNNITVSNKSPKTTVNWILNEGVEILNANTGKTVLGKISRLSELSLLNKYIKLKKNSNYLCNIEIYRKIKQQNMMYNYAKTHFYELLRTKNLGYWFKKSHIN